MEEKWKDIKGYEGFQVSNLGNILSNEHKVLMPNGGYKIIKQRLIKPIIMPSGYLQVTLGRTHNTRKRFYIHRLVAKAFPEICGNMFLNCQVDHINTIRNDNRAINLRWVTAKENQNNPLSKKKQSEIKKGKKRPESFKEKIRTIQKGKKLSDITKQKISKSNTNNPKTSTLIKCIDLTTNKTKVFPSIHEAARQMKIYRSAITQSIHRYKSPYKNRFIFSEIKNEEEN